MSLSVHIEKRAGDFLLKIDFEHEEGIAGILGASGCGKSMTLQCIAGIIKPDKGRIVLNGRVLFDSEKKICLKPQERRVGYLFQNYALFPNMTVHQNILCGLCGEKDKKRKKEKLEKMLGTMELEECKNLYPHQLSGGQQQRCALARILVSEPELLLLDEPFSALDAYLREHLQIRVREILEEYGRDALMVSHSRDEIYYICSHTAVLQNGRLLKYGETKKIFADPGYPSAAVLTGCKNIAGAEKTGTHEVFVPDWGISLKTKQPVGDNLCAVGLRAHYFQAESGENCYPVVYSAKREDPFEYRILFRYARQKEGTAPLWWRMSKDKRPEIMPECLGISPENVLLLYSEEAHG